MIKAESLDELFQNIPISEYLIGDGILPRGGKMLLYGASKVGKSLILNQIALSVASGEDFLSYFDVPQPLKVYMVQCEIIKESFANRIGKAKTFFEKVLPSENFYATTVFDLKLDTRDGYHALCEILDTVKPDILCIDPLYKVMTGDESRVQDARKLVDNLDNIIQKYNLSVIIVHHSRKSSSDPQATDKGIDESRGSSLIPAWADTIIGVRKDGVPGELKAKLVFDLRHSETPSVLHLECDDHLIWKIKSNVGAPIKVSLPKIREILAQNTGVMPFDELAVAVRKQLSVTDKTAKSSITRNVNAGFLLAEETMSGKTMIKSYHFRI